VKHFFLTILILNLLKVNSQSLDSLLTASLKLKTDTERINLFYREGFSNRAIDPQYSFNCAKEAERCAQKVGSPYYTAKANNLLGILYYRKNDLVTALSYHKKALKLRIIILDKKGIAASEINLGNIYGELKRYTLAEKAYLKALNINNELNDQKQVGNCLLNLGVLKTELGSSGKDSANIIPAKIYFDKALENAKTRNDYELEAECLNNLAVINTILKKFDAAVANCLNSIKIKDLMDNKMEMADSYLNLAVVFLKKGETQSCLVNLQIADSIITKYNYITAKISLLKLKSEFYEQTKNYPLAFKFISEHYKLKDSLEKINLEIKPDNNFTETVLLAENKKSSEPGFPYLFMNILIILSILIIGFAFKFKR
jgi:tetratricopeptide (TPR) repeat protein